MPKVNSGPGRKLGKGQSESGNIRIKIYKEVKIWYIGHLLPNSHFSLKVNMRKQKGLLRR